MFQIRLKNTSQFACSTEDTILVGAQKEGVHLNYSCKTGRCKSCKAKLVEGSTLAILEEIGLSQEEGMEGYILTCVRKPASDLKLDIEDLSGYSIEPIKIIPSKIDSITKLNQDVIELKLRIPTNTNFSYLAGQYINIIKGDYKRSYSLASNDTSSGLNLYIKNYEGGKFSQYLFKDAKENDLLRIEGPMGTFFYRDTNKTNLIFLATGTGIAPIKAILEDLNMNSEKVTGKSIYLFSGARIQGDFIWEPKFDNINVQYIPVLSRAKEGWDGAKGYVQDVMIEKGISLVDSLMYVCGSENMIQDALHVSTLNGLSEQDFFSDAFIPSN